MNGSSWFWLPSLKWCPTSSSALEHAELNILKYLKKPFVIKYVTIPSFNKEEENLNIRTLIINENCSEEDPVVLIHGFASGMGFWVMNLDSIAENRTVYALDLPGFGLSSRPQFSYDADEIEQQYVECIENWCQCIGLKKFVLLGHSLGAFLATAYSLKYPDEINHLILADPWGFADYDRTVSFNSPIWAKDPPWWGKLIDKLFSFVYPLSPLRALGPLGPYLVKNFRTDILHKFVPSIGEPSILSNYIYHCNAQSPTGEGAFKYMSYNYGWAKSPMTHRIHELREDIPITFIYGSKSWVKSDNGVKVQEIRKNSYVDIKMIEGAGHHLYADDVELFNSIVKNIGLKSN